MATQDNSQVSAQTTLSAAQDAGGLTKIKPNQAVTTIDSWVSKLEGVDGGAAIQEDLRSLKSQLGSSSPDGGKIASILSKLGSATSTAGQGDADLTKLGQALTQAGQQLQQK